MAEQPFTIGGQSQVTVRDTTGVYVQAVRVFFTVGSLGPFSVDVPLSGYAPETVQALISDYTNHILQVQALGS